MSSGIYIVQIYYGVNDMKILIFGTGKIYQELKNRIRADVEMVGFLDNDEKKQGRLLDGKKIYPPREALYLDYDIIFLMCYYHADMREQLIQMGIDDNIIFDINRPYTVLNRKEAMIYGNINKFHNKLIVLFSHSLTSTGAQNVLYQAALLMKENNYDVIVISREDGIQRAKYLTADIPIIICEDILSENELLDELIRKAYLIWINTLWLYYIADYFKNTSVKATWWIHEASSIRDVSSRVFRGIAASSNVQILSVSSLVDENLWDLYGKDIRIRRLLFGLKDYYGFKRNNVNSKEKIILACIGGISNSKGQDILIDAIDGIPDDIKAKIRVWIIGSGSLDEHYSCIIQRNECIEWMGEIDNSKMPEIYEALDGVVCCSRQESMSVAVAEACMNRKFSIVSDGAGISRLLQDKKNALLFQSENINDLQKKIIWVINNLEQARNMGQMSRKLYDQYFTMDIFERNLKGYIT